MCLAASECLSVLYGLLNLERLDLQTSFSVRRYIFRASRSRTMHQGQGHISITEYIFISNPLSTERQSCFYSYLLAQMAIFTSAELYLLQFSVHLQPQINRTEVKLYITLRYESVSGE